MTRAAPHSLKFLLAVAVVLNILLWASVRDTRSEWANVPPVPGVTGAASFALGDTQLAYRGIGIMLQNLGDEGGRATPLKAYNYDELAKWFYIEDQLDPHSAYIPSLAAYYFSAVEDPDKLHPVLDYLATVGSRPEGQNWRWLAQAVHIARFVMGDLDKALILARRLAAVDNPDMPPWTRQMPAFILEAKGDKDDALSIMIEILRSDAEKLDPTEINYMRDYICNRILDEKAALAHPLCQDPIP